MKKEISARQHGNLGKICPTAAGYEVGCPVLDIVHGTAPIL